MAGEDLRRAIEAEVRAALPDSRWLAVFGSTAIDLAMHVVRTASLGGPKSSRDAFAWLADGGWIASDLAEELQRMVGFRNVAVRR